jgi:phosphate transport system protein
MTQHLQRDLARVKRHVLNMGGLAEDALKCARTAFESRSRASADILRKFERAIDQLQVEIDDEILKVLALHQPVAGDLRFIMAAMKIVNDLERIGDLTESIANRLVMLVDTGKDYDSLNLDSMMTKSSDMLRDALRAFVELNSELARDVLARDDEIDEMNRVNFETLIKRMQEAPDSVEASVALLSMSRAMERIADLATNIAEDVIFIVEATDVRHMAPPA